MSNVQTVAVANWRSIMDSLVSRVALLDRDGEIVAVNASWRQFVLDTGEESSSVGDRYLPAYEVTVESDAGEVLAGLRGLACGALDVYEVVYPHDTPAGRLWYLLRAVPYEGGRDGWVVVSHHDVTEARGDRERVKQQAAVLDQIDAAVCTVDLKRKVLTWSGGAERLFGWTAEQAIGRLAEDLMLPEGMSMEPGVLEAATTRVWSGELNLCRRGGTVFPAYARTSIATDPLGAPESITCVVMDITEKRQSRRDLTAAQNHLRVVADTIDEGMFTLDRNGRLTYMNAVTEQSLGWTLENVLGDGFQGLIRSRHLDAARELITRRSATGTDLSSEAVKVNDDVFRRADGKLLPVAYTASPYATDEGIEGLVVVFQDITEHKAEEERLEREIEKLQCAKRIRSALANEDFVLFAQPIIDLRTAAVVQRELLIRMRDPEDRDRVISPGAFLPVAEEYALIGDIDRWVIDQSAQLAAGGLPVEINVSAASISDPRLITHIRSALSRSGADPALIVFEITETALVSDEQASRRFVEQMHQLGCRVALDDFGTGYGGFTYLKQLQIDYLKIDVEFVRDLDTDLASRNVVETIVSLAKRFGLRTIAEGVEDSGVLSLLSELGVDYAQGYHIGRPAPLGGPVTLASAVS